MAFLLVLALGFFWLGSKHSDAWRFRAVTFQGSRPKNTAPSSERCRNAQTALILLGSCWNVLCFIRSFNKNRELFESKRGLCHEIWRKCSYGSFFCLLLPWAAATGSSKCFQEESLVPSLSTMDKPGIKSCGNCQSARERNSHVEYF